MGYGKVDGKACDGSSYSRAINCPHGRLGICFARTSCSSIVNRRGCLERAIQGSESTLSTILFKAKFWEKYEGEKFNERQRKIINKLLDGFEGHLTSSKWAEFGKCSQDTASRDIDDLIKRKILQKSAEGGRSTSYFLVTSL